MSDTLDPEVLELVNALNTFPGVRTIESCCGHGSNVFNIWFVVEGLKELSGVLYHVASCNSGIYGWNVAVADDCSCGGSPIHFKLYSKTKGGVAYSEATKIAEIMMQREEKT